MTDRRDDNVVPLNGQARVVDFLTSFESWKTAPHDELVDNGAYCLADPGELYAVYPTYCGSLSLRVEPSRYEATWFNAHNGPRIKLPPAEKPQSNSAAAPDRGD